MKYKLLNGCDCGFLHLVVSYLKIKQRTALKNIFITDGTGMTESFYYRLGHHSSNLNGERVWIYFLSDVYWIPLKFN